MVCLFSMSVSVSNNFSVSRLETGTDEAAFEVEERKKRHTERISTVQDRVIIITKLNT